MVQKVKSNRLASLCTGSRGKYSCCAFHEARDAPNVDGSVCGLVLCLCGARATKCAQLGTSTVWLGRLGQPIFWDLSWVGSGNTCQGQFEAVIRGCESLGLDGVPCSAVGSLGPGPMII